MTDDMNRQAEMEITSQDAKAADAPAAQDGAQEDSAQGKERTVADTLSRQAMEQLGPEGGAPSLDLVMRIPVSVQAVLGQARMSIAALMKLGPGSVVPLDHKVGEPVDVVVNGRLVARGEVVLLEEDNERFGISLTEIAGPDGGLC